MNTAKMSEWIKYPRRRFLSVAAMSFAAAELGTIGSANVQSDKPQAGLPKIKPGTITSFSPLKQLDAGSAADPEGRVAVVVSILFCNRTRSRWLREIPARLCEAHLATRLAEMELR
jgi:hypothetical protein